MNPNGITPDPKALDNFRAKQFAFPPTGIPEDRNLNQVNSSDIASLLGRAGDAARLHKDTIRAARNKQLHRLGAGTYLLDSNVSQSGSSRAFARDDTDMTPRTYHVLGEGPELTRLRGALDTLNYIGFFGETPANSWGKTQLSLRSVSIDRGVTSGNAYGLVYQNSQDVFIDDIFLDGRRDADHYDPATWVAEGTNFRSLNNTKRLRIYRSVSAFSDGHAWMISPNNPGLNVIPGNSAEDTHIVDCFSLNHYGSGVNASGSRGTVVANLRTYNDTTLFGNNVPSAYAITRFGNEGYFNRIWGVYGSNMGRGFRMVDQQGTIMTTSIFEATSGAIAIDNGKDSLNAFTNYGWGSVFYNSSRGIGYQAPPSEGTDDESDDDADAPGSTAFAIIGGSNVDNNYYKLYGGFSIIQDPTPRACGSIICNTASNIVVVVDNVLVGKTYVGLGRRIRSYDDQRVSPGGAVVFSGHNVPAGYSSLIYTDASVLNGKIKSILSYQFFSGTNGSGTEQTSPTTALSSVYVVLLDGNALSTVGTLGAVSTLSNPFTTTNASTSVKVTQAGHGKIVNDVVVFTRSASVGGLVIAGKYTVATVVDANNYTITHLSTATSTAGPAGGTVSTFIPTLNSGSKYRYRNTTIQDDWSFYSVGQGTISASTGSATVTGIGSAFINQIQNYIMGAGATKVYLFAADTNKTLLGSVSSVTNDTSLTLIANSRQTYEGGFYLSLEKKVFFGMTADGNSNQLQIPWDTINVPTDLVRVNPFQIDPASLAERSKPKFTISINGPRDYTGAGPWYELVDVPYTFEGMMVRLASIEIILASDMAGDAVNFTTFQAERLRYDTIGDTTTISQPAAMTVNIDNVARKAGKGIKITAPGSADADLFNFGNTVHPTYGKYFDTIRLRFSKNAAGTAAMPAMIVKFKFAPWANTP